MHTHRHFLPGCQAYTPGTAATIHAIATRRNSQRHGVPPARVFSQCAPTIVDTAAITHGEVIRKSLRHLKLTVAPYCASDAPSPCRWVGRHGCLLSSPHPQCASPLPVHRTPRHADLGTTVPLSSF